MIGVPKEQAPAAGLRRCARFNVGTNKEAPLARGFGDIKPVRSDYLHEAGNHLATMVVLAVEAVDTLAGSRVAAAGAAARPHCQMKSPFLLR